MWLEVLHCPKAWDVLISLLDDLENEPGRSKELRTTRRVRSLWPWTRRTLQLHAADVSWKKKALLWSVLAALATGRECHWVPENDRCMQLQGPDMTAHDLESCMQNCCANNPVGANPNKPNMTPWPLIKCEVWQWDPINADQRKRHTAGAGVDRASTARITPCPAMSGRADVGVTLPVTAFLKMRASVAARSS